MLHLRGGYFYFVFPRPKSDCCVEAISSSAAAAKDSSKFGTCCTSNNRLYEATVSFLYHNVRLEEYVGFFFCLFCFVRSRGMCMMCMTPTQRIIGPHDAANLRRREEGKDRGIRQGKHHEFYARGKSMILASKSLITSSPIACLECKDYEVIIHRIGDVQGSFLPVMRWPEP